MQPLPLFKDEYLFLSLGNLIFATISQPGTRLSYSLPRDGDARHKNFSETQLEGLFVAKCFTESGGQGNRYTGAKRGLHVVSAIRAAGGLSWRGYGESGFGTRQLLRTRSCQMQPKLSANSKEDQLWASTPHRSGKGNNGRRSNSAWTI